VLALVVVCFLPFAARSEGRPAAGRARIVMSAISSGMPHVGSTAALAAAYPAGTTITFAGRVVPAPAGGSVLLEQHGNAWRVEKRVRLDRNGSFALGWSPTAPGAATMRLTATTAAGRVLAHTAPHITRILAKGCAIPQIAPADPDEGLLVGGLYVAGPYLEGGAMNPTTGQTSLAPRPLGCDWQPYTVAISGSSNQTVRVAANGGYAVAVPPGQYSLAATYKGQTCRGSGTIVAGQQTEIDTFCDLVAVP
jgi:hypothetical protein